LAILPVYTYEHPVLRKKAKPVRSLDDDIMLLAKDMFETLHASNGIGLAANQVGSLQRLIVVDVSEMEDSGHIKPVAMINPEVVDEKGTWVMEEGCLSIPEIRAEVERPEQIVVRYKDMGFVDREIEADGIFGRVILHEIDHLNGVLFIDYLDTQAQKQLRGRLNKIRRGEVDVPYQIVAELPTAETVK
jgi:peptide deformylase